MVKGVNVVVWCVALMVVGLVAAHIRVTTAANCNPLELRPCAPAIFSGGNPSAECCEKLKEQQPCFCEYAKNPMLKPLINDPNAKRIAAACSVRPPKCPLSFH